MSAAEYVTIAIVTGLIAAIVISVLLGYGRRIGRGGKSLGWLFVLALILVPAGLFYLGSGGFLAGDASYEREAAAPVQEEEADGYLIPDVEREKMSKSVVRKTRKRKVARRAAPKTEADGTPGTRTADEPEPSSPPVFENLEVSPEPGAAEPEAVRIGDAESEKYDTVKILFGTDRQRDTSNERLSFGADRAGELTLGQANVTIPKNHDRGIVERPWEFSIVGITIYKQKEDPDKHFTIQKIGVLDEDAFISAANAQLASSSEYRKQAVIFIHGYNNDFDTALYRSAQMVYDMGFDGAPFLYSWPSAAGYATYEYDQQSARQSVVHLRRFIQLVTEKTDAEKIHLVAHSMGNDVLLEALRELRFQYGPDHDYKISQVILAAPDVDRNVFENLARQIAGMGKGVTLYASANDKALQASATYAGGIARAGDVPEGGPVIINGVDTIDVSATQQDFWGLNHNTYAETSELMKDIRKLFLTGVRPPVNRTPSLVPVEIPDGTYWRFPGAP